MGQGFCKIREKIMAVPIPTRKPELNGSKTSILGDIWNSAKGVFEYMGGIKLEQWTADQLKDIREAEEQAKMQKRLKMQI